MDEFIPAADHLITPTSHPFSGNLTVYDGSSQISDMDQLDCRTGTAIYLTGPDGDIGHQRSFTELQLKQSASPEAVVLFGVFYLAMRKFSPVIFSVEPASKVSRSIRDQVKESIKARTRASADPSPLNKAVDKAVDQAVVHGVPPRVTNAMVEDAIKLEIYHVFPGTTTTVCALILQNGFVVTGDSSSVAAENFDVNKGRARARFQAVKKIWPLEAYLLKETVALQKETVALL